jgi:transcription elongation factor S-II
MSVRTHIQSIIATRLGSYISADQQKDLEKGIYNAAIQDANAKGVRKHWENPEFTDLYKVVARRVVANLDPDAYIGNQRLIQRLQENEFPAHRVPCMTAKELYPEHWQQMADEQMKRENTMLEGDKEGGSDMFKCKRCGKSKTKYWEMQTRSADEPMTIFIRCLNCGKEWRQ